jgi:hypothetical protein
MMIETKLGCCLNGLFLIARGRFSVCFLVGGGEGDFLFRKKKKKKNQPEKYDFQTDKGFLSKNLH